MAFKYMQKYFFAKEKRDFDSSPSGPVGLISFFLFLNDIFMFSTHCVNLLLRVKHKLTIATL